MHMSKISIAAVLATLASVNALSSSCLSEITSLSLSGDLANCLQLVSLLPVISSSGSVIPSINSYLSSLCASSTPTCSQSTLSSANSNIASSCSSDLSGGGSGALEVQALQQLLQHYDNVYAAGCAKNSTENQYCVTSTLYTIQNSTGQQLSTSFLTGLLSGSGDGLQQIQQVAQSGKLCTGCVQTIYQQAVDANSSIANSAAATGLKNTCGDSFISTSSTASGVSAVASSNAATSSAAAAGTSGAAGSTYSLPSLMPILMGGMVMTVATVVGGSLVL